jgi:hypothetical protein
MYRFFASHQARKKKHPQQQHLQEHRKKSAELQKKINKLQEYRQKGQQVVIVPDVSNLHCSSRNGSSSNSCSSSSSSGSGSRDSYSTLTTAAETPGATTLSPTPSATTPPRFTMNLHRGISSKRCKLPTEISILRHEPSLVEPPRSRSYIRPNHHQEVFRKHSWGNKKDYCRPTTTSTTTTAKANRRDARVDILFTPRKHEWSELDIRQAPSIFPSNFLNMSLCMPSWGGALDYLPPPTLVLTVEDLWDSRCEI